MIRKNYYLILGVPRTESASGLRQAFRTLVKRYHPERVGPRGLRFFADILEAYRMLADPVRRHSYDQGLSHAEGSVLPSPDLQVLPPEAHATLPQVVTPLRHTIAAHPAFTAALAHVARQWTRGRVRMEQPWEGIDVHVLLSPEEAARGGTIFLTVPSCLPCQACGGSGQEGLFPCTACQGEGFLDESETVRITIPPQVGDGARLEAPLRGLGVHGFYLRVHIRVAS
ncbi:MAG TPA: DnaJ domain-containing protein [Methylomirabilota bacterium]|nr:DnaJ domain-containing protein [Methylomirabilota bacterium]